MNQQTIQNGSHSDLDPADNPRRQKTILIADDDPLVVLSLSHRLQRLGYQVCSSADATEALLEIEKTKPDLAILDIQMPSGNGVAICEMLACNRECANIPVIVHSVVTDEAVKRQCQRFKTHYVEKSPRSAKEVEALVESLLDESRSLDAEPSDSLSPVAEDRPAEETAGKRRKPLDRLLHHVLCIDDDPVMLRSIVMRLEPYGLKVVGIDNGAKGYLQATTDPPDLILLDLRLPGGAGNFVLEKLKADPKTKDIPVIVLTMEYTSGVQRQIMSLGADGFLTKPVHWPTLFAEMGRCMQLPQQILDDLQLSPQPT